MLNVSKLTALLSEDREVAKQRQAAWGQRLREHPETPVVLFGAGGVGRRLCGGMHASGIDVAGFSDNAPGLWGRTLEGVSLLSPGQAIRDYGAQGVFVVTIFNPEHRYLDTRERLTAAGCCEVVPWMPVAWSLGHAALPQYAVGMPTEVLDAAGAILAQARCWADDASLGEYERQIAWRLAGDFDLLGVPLPDQYFAADVVRLQEQEVFVDCGAYDGDTTLDLLRRAPNTASVHAIEPDAQNFEALTHAIAGLAPEQRRHIHLHRLAAASHNGTVRFATGGGTAAAVATDADGSCHEGSVDEVSAATLDDLLGDAPVTFIKMDVEGSEAEALRGAARILREQRPVLAVSAYHRPRDLWELPALLSTLTDDYALYLRSHGFDSFESVLYGVPSERMMTAKLS